MTYRIRRAESSEDIATIARLDALMFPGVPALTDGAPSAWWVAVCDGNIAAFAGAKVLQAEPDTLYLNRAGVVRAHRGQGLQKRLIRARLAYGKRNGCTKVVTYTYDNPASANSLISCGFRMYHPAGPWVEEEAICYWMRDL